MQNVRRSPIKLCMLPGGPVQKILKELLNLIFGTSTICRFHQQGVV